MAQFFINRPIFAWVIALFILVMGGVAVTQLPVSQYPPVAPPSIVISAGYPGASAQTLENSVLSVIERTDFGVKLRAAIDNPPRAAARSSNRRRPDGR